MGDGEGDVSGDTLLGPPPPPGLFRACLTAKCWTLGPQAVSWQKGKEEKSFAYCPCHLMKGKLVWGRPRATDVGAEPAKTVLRGRE